MAATLRFRTVSAVVLIFAAFASASGPVSVSTQYHAQDEHGQYSYGYAGGPSSKSEIKTADGVVRGQYSYIDAHGIIQTATYIADPVHGFRVAATNDPVSQTPVHSEVHAPVHIAPIHHAPEVVYHHAPAVAHYSPPGVDTPEVQVAKAHHFAAVAEAKARNAAAVHHEHVGGYYPSGAAYVPYAAAHSHPAYYLSVKDTPEVAAAKAAHFAEVHEAKSRAHHAYSHSGSYDHYGHGLYHVPVPVKDTPEVAHAKAAHLAAVHEAKTHAYTGYPYYGGHYGYASGHAAYHVPVPVKDTHEVALAKAAHFAAVHEAKSRVHYDHSHSGAGYYPYASGHAAYHVPVPVKDTPEVAAAKAAHFAAVHETKARDYHSYPAGHHGYYNYDGHHGYAPVPVTDTPAVAHAKAAHLATVEHVKYSHHGW